MRALIDLDAERLDDGTPFNDLRFKELCKLIDAEAMERFTKELVALWPDLIFSQSTPTTATWRPVILRE
jgi:hypothetical protein